MSGKSSLLLASVALSLLLAVSGCGPSADLSLRFSPESTASYVVTTEVTKDFRFEQPTMDKLREEQTKTLIEVGFTQTVIGVDAKGVAECAVTIDRLSVYMTNKNEERLVFDSTNEAHQSNPLSRLIGQRYTVQLSPVGKVVGFESAAAQRAVTAGFEGRLAQRLVNEEGIRERHEIPALWGIGKGAATVSKSWTQVAPSPPGLLAPKSFEKVYTLTGMDTRNGQKVAVVNMNAREAAEPAEGQIPASSMGMGFFARMFDSQDDYTGTLLLNTENGDVLEYNETLISTYLAQEMPMNAPANAEPDTLIMRFTNRISMQKVHP